MIVSLYDWKKFMTNPMAMAMNEDPINWSNIHAYSQGKYIASTFTEQKIGKDQKSQNISSMIFRQIGSFATQEIKSKVTDEIANYLDVAFEDICTADIACDLIVIVFEILKHFFVADDFGQNTPSSSAGLQAATFERMGLGGNIETVYVQLYDPYNFQNVNFFEYDNCTGQSLNFAAHNYTMDATTNTLTELD